MSNIVTQWEWSSHAPVLKALLGLFKFDFILELGTGKYSTPLLAATEAKLWCIDNDPAWLKLVQDELPSREQETAFIYHNLGPDVSIGTRAVDISDAKRQEIRGYYDALKIPETGLKMAFVDQFTCARTISIATLLSKFDVLVYHDCEPAGYYWYEYRFDEQTIANHRHLTFKTSNPWTGIFIKKDLQFSVEDLITSCRYHSVQYAKEIGADSSSMRLEVET